VSKETSSPQVPRVFAIIAGVMAGAILVLGQVQAFVDAVSAAWHAILGPAAPVARQVRAGDEERPVLIPGQTPLQ
jgi:hypothetical protein